MDDDQPAIRVLGPVQLWRASERLTVGGAQRRALLGYLALRAGAAVPADVLARVLGTKAVTGAALQTHVTRLRTVLRRAADGRPTPRIEYHGGYRLVVETAEVDLLVLRDAVRRARTASSAAARRDTLAPACGQIRGRPLADLPHLDGDPVTVGVGAEITRAVLELADAALAVDDPTVALRPLRTLLTYDGFDEAVSARLMLVLAATGHRAAGLQLYRELRERLVDELGVDPGREVSDAFAQILGGERVAAAGRAPAAVPEAAVPRPAQLPTAVSDFAGRSAHVDRLRRLLTGAAADADGGTDGAVRVVTIGGVGGVGKTALAVHVGHLERRRFPDGQLFVDLAGETPHPAQPDEVLAGLLDTLGVTQVPADLAARAALFRSVLDRRRVLLVLDNARDPEQVRQLVPGGAGNAVVVTSRRSMAGLAGARHIELSMFSRAESLDLLRRICGPRRVAAEPDAADELARACSDLPLAIRIAGSRLTRQPAWSVRYLADRLGGGLDELRDGDLAVRATLALSYDLLDPAAARVFRMLGALPGMEIPLSAAVALLDDPKLEPLLEELVDTHLLGSPAPGRYRLHDLLRQYAAELGARDDPTAERRGALDRIARYASATAQNAHAAMYPDRPAAPAQDVVTSPYARSFGGYDDALEWWRREFAGLDALTGQALDGDMAPQVPARLALTMTRYHQLRNDWPGYERAARLGLRLADRAGDGRLSARLCVNLTVCLTAMQRLDETTEYHQRALREFRALGDSVNEARVIGNIACQDMVAGRYAPAVDGFRAAVDLAHRSGDADGETFCLVGMAESLVRWRRYERAEAPLREALRRATAAGAAHHLTCVWELLTGMLAGLGRGDEAVEAGRYALDLCRTTGDDENREAILIALTGAYRVAGDLDAALDHALLAVSAPNSGGRPLVRAEALTEFGRVLSALGRTGEARDRWRAARHLYHDLGHPDEAEVVALLAAESADR